MPVGDPRPQEVWFWRETPSTVWVFLLMERYDYTNSCGTLSLSRQFGVVTGTVRIDALLENGGLVYTSLGRPDPIAALEALIDATRRITPYEAAEWAETVSMGTAIERDARRRGLYPADREARVPFPLTLQSMIGFTRIQPHPGSLAEPPVTADKPAPPPRTQWEHLLDDD
jgi:hypothetical protein